MNLLTSRLSLREYVGSDVHPTHQWRCDPRYLEHSPSDGYEISHSEELIERFIGWQSTSPRRRWQLAIERRDTVELIGSGGVRTKGETDTADIGHELDPRHWGNGFATEAMGRLVTFAFEEASLRLLTARAVCRNERSLRVLERLGFERAETIPTGVIPDGTVWPDRYEYHLHG